MAQTAYDKALYLLSGREHTEKELREKLLSKGYGPTEIDGALSKLKKENYISEERFAEVYIRSRLRKSPEGRSILKMRLMEKGTPREIAEEALKEAWESGAYLEPLKEAFSSYEKKKGKEYATGKMLQKGFSMREIQEAGREEEDV